IAFASDEGRRLSPIHRYFPRGLRAFSCLTFRKDLNALAVFVVGEREVSRPSLGSPMFVPGRSAPEKERCHTHEEEKVEQCHDRRHRGCVMHWPWIKV
ncbi:hypothetical protein A2U01_0030900, partial [Trifolium medium]|nr:hypothetical protein [Trifolium medium]